MGRCSSLCVYPVGRCSIHIQVTSVSPAAAVGANRTWFQNTFSTVLQNRVYIPFPFSLCHKDFFPFEFCAYIG